MESTQNIDCLRWQLVVLKDLLDKSKDSLLVKISLENRINDIMDEIKQIENSEMNQIVNQTSDIQIKTLESCKTHADESRAKIKANIERCMKEFNIDVIPAGDFQFGVSLLESENPYDNIDNIISQFHNCMMTAWRSQLELMALKGEIANVVQTKIKIIDK